jgi:hypothetical protein
MWSKFIGNTYSTETSVQIIAQDIYTRNGSIQYHNWGHILDCYKYLEDEQVEYDEDLDFAVMYHDVIYDEKPDKELRSTGFMLHHFPKRTRAAEIIMATVGHKITEDTPWQERMMIKADLHQLADPVQATRNYVKIMDESIYLYKITPLEFAKNNAIFMMNMQNTVFANMQVDTDQKFWEAVRQGMEHTIIISQSMQKLLEPWRGLS